MPPRILIKIMSDSDESDLGRAPRRGGRKTGVPNYQNNILIRIVERLLPNGNKGWSLVALAYKEESGEENLRSEDDLKKNWVRKLCNNMKKPTGRMGRTPRIGSINALPLRGGFLTTHHLESSVDPQKMS